MNYWYFVIENDENGPLIRGWSNEKSMVKYYVDFHNCSKFSIKRVEMSRDEINKVIEENINDEISMVNIAIRDVKHHSRTRYISIPATSTEVTLINGEVGSFYSSHIDYSFIESKFPYLKNKYKRAMANILLPLVIRHLIHNDTDSSIYLQNVELDQLLILYNLLPDNFG